MAPPTSAQFSLTLRVRIDHRPGMLGRVATAIGEAGGTIGDIELVDRDGLHTLRDLTVDAGDEAHERGIVEAVRAVDGAEVVDWSDRTLGMHVGGKLEVALKHPLRTAGRPLDGLHARRRARLHGDRRGPGQGVPVHDQAQHGRRRDRRQRRARPGRHRPARPRCR